MTETTEIYPSPSNSLHLANLAPDTDYTVRVRARDAAGNYSGWSTPITFTTPADIGTPEHSVFGATAYGGRSLSVFADGTPNIRLTQAFYAAGSGATGFRCKGGRVYIPAGASVPSTITIMAYQTTGATPDLSTTPVATKTVTATPGSWAEAIWDSPITMVTTGTYGNPVWIAYEFPGSGKYFAGGVLRTGHPSTSPAPRIRAGVPPSVSAPDRRKCLPCTAPTASTSSWTRGNQSTCYVHELPQPANRLGRFCAFWRTRLTTVDPEADWQGRLDRAMRQVRTWEAMIQEPRAPEAGSALAGDNRQTPVYMISSLAWWGLISAVDHLALAADAYAGSGNRLRPDSPFTVTRTALMGASQAVFLLEPAQRTERDRRSLLVERMELEGHNQFLNDYLNDDHLDADASFDLLASMRAMSERLKARKEAIIEIVGRAPLQTTTIMKEAARSLAGGDQWQRRALDFEWRVSSGAAHSRLWPIFVRGHDAEQLEDGGHVRRRHTTLPEFVQAYGAAVLTTSKAFELWEQRSRSHIRS